MVVIVIGAGVAGLMAAGVAARKGHSVLVLEKMEKPARKLRITGKGRCNITNTKGTKEFLGKVNSGADFVEFSLSRFDTAATYAFFEKRGLSLIVERGDRVFPASGKAWDVASALISWAVEGGAEIRSHSPVGEIITDEAAKVMGVRLENGDMIECQSVILTTGGVSYPSTGSSGDGHQMAYELGHQVVELRPALVPLEVESRVQGQIALRNVSLGLVVDDVVVESRFGDVEFTAQAGVVGGAITLQLSGMAVDAVIDRRKVELLLDLKPALSAEKLKNRILREKETLQNATLKVLLQKLTPSPLHAHLIDQCDMSLKTPLEAITDDQVKLLVDTLKALRFKVKDYRPFSEAIVTAGGVDLSQVDSHTMQSQLIKGLYMAGELLDIDADTGGYNIQIALSTGRLAGELLD